MQRRGGSRESDAFVVRILDVCWWEGVAREARRGKGSERRGLGPLPLGDGAPKRIS